MKKSSLFDQKRAKRKKIKLKKFDLFDNQFFKTFF
jgi:hypothetical protein